MSADSLALAEGLREFYLKAHRLLDQAMKREGISFARLKLLLFIHRSGSVRATDIADFFGHAPRTVTEAVDGLEREGLVARVPDPNDRRAKNIRITEAGNAIILQAEPVRDYWMKRVFSALEPAEYALMLDIFDRLRTHMEMIASDLPEPEDVAGCSPGFLGDPARR